MTMISERAVTQKKPEKRGRGRPIEGEEKREITAFKFEPTFLRRLRNLAHATEYTATQIIEEGARIVMDRLEKDYERQHGHPVPDAPVKKKR